MHLQFQGAARTVTGSMHILTVAGKTVLLDCGTYHGRREEARRRNQEFPFDPASIVAVVLSHAHIDHSGNLPGLVKQGFRGPIFCTHATKSLCEIMLMDSAHIQERDAEFINKRHRTKGDPKINPLYTVENAKETMPLFIGRDYGSRFNVTESIECRFEDAGHILGSASVSLSLRENSRGVNLAFTGDLGRPHLPILRDPVFIDKDHEATYLICESTYGGRFHAPVAEMSTQLLGPLRRACERRGKIIIPAFSVGRTQEIVYVLHKLSSEGAIDNLPVFVDSPLSVNVTDVFKKHPECFDGETRAILQESPRNDPFGFASLTYIRSLEESKALNDRSGPFIVIAASGMCEAGRVVHHLANSVGDPRNMVLIVGYQAEHTLGKKLVLHEPVVNILGEPRDVRAEIVVLNSFSGHADRNELLDYIRQFDLRTMRQVFLVHGDPDQSEKLASGLHDTGFSNVSIPVRGERAGLT
jgi:metallo-beta-lactamase family protein